MGTNTTDIVQKATNSVTNYPTIHQSLENTETDSIEGFTTNHHSLQKVLPHFHNLVESHLLDELTVYYHEWNRCHPSFCLSIQPLTFWQSPNSEVLQ